MSKKCKCGKEAVVIKPNGKNACVDWLRDNMVMLDKRSQKYSVNVRQHKESTN